MTAIEDIQEAISTMEASLATDLPHHLVQGTAMASVAPSVLTSALARAGGGHVRLV